MGGVGVLQIMQSSVDSIWVVRVFSNYSILVDTCGGGCVGCFQIMLSSVDSTWVWLCLGCGHASNYAIFSR